VDRGWKARLKTAGHFPRWTAASEPTAPNTTRTQRADSCESFLTMKTTLALAQCDFAGHQEASSRRAWTGRKKALFSCFA